MKFLFVVIVVLFISPSVLAQPARDAAVSMTDAQMLAHCDARHGSHRTATVAQCVTGLRFKKAEAISSALAARMREGETRDKTIFKRLGEVGDRVDLLARPATAQTQTNESGPPRLPAPREWIPVEQPTVMSIYSLVGMAHDTFHIMSLDHSTARKACGGVGAPLVVFLDHGVPITNVIAPAGAPTNGFVEVFWDRQNDGTPDGTVKALDLSTQTDVWITWGLRSDFEIRYLRPGSQGAVHGLPLQTLFHPTVRAEVSASGAIGCDDDFTPRGGHKADHAYSLSRMRR